MLFVCSSFWFWFVEQLRLRLGRKSGTFSVLEIGSTQMERDQTGQQLQGIGRQRALIRT